MGAGQPLVPGQLSELLSASHGAPEAHAAHHPRRLTRSATEGGVSRASRVSSR